MSVLRQRIANRFPLWSKVRSDPSSLGQRIFDSFGDWFDFALADAVKFKDDSKLLRRGFGKSYLYTVDLSDEFDILLTASGIGLPTYPVLVQGTTEASQIITLTRDEFLEDMLFGGPTRIETDETITVADWLIWDSSVPTQFADLSFPNQLTIVVSDSTEYFRKTSDKNRFFRNRFFVQLGGKDLNGIPLTEQVWIFDDGVYQTEHIYSELTLVQFEGFDGDINIYQAYIDTPHKQDPFRNVVLPELEGPLLERLDEIEAGTSTLVAFTNILKRGFEYRTGSGDITENTETLIEHVLQDSTGANYSAVDFAISPESTQLYVLDSSAVLHVYDWEVAPFVPNAAESTKQNSIVLLPIYAYPRLDRDEFVWTWMRQPKQNIVSVTIKRIDPAAVVRYLQPDYTWGAGTYSFPGKDGLTPEASWQDFRFFTTYDQLGQWDYICTVVLRDQTIEVSVLSVVVPSLRANDDFDTDVASPTGLCFIQDGRLGVTTAGSIVLFTQHRDTYYADVANQRLHTAEPYVSVGVDF